MLLPAYRKLDDAFGVEVASVDVAISIGDADVVDADRVVGNRAAHLSIRGGKASLHKQRRQTDSAFEIGVRNRDRRQPAVTATLLERLPCSVGSGIGGILAMQQRCRLVGENLLRLVDLGTSQPLEPRDLVEGQLGE